MVYLVSQLSELQENTEQIQIYQELAGSQLGEYFGAAFAAVDLDGDGLDDLVVGSPMATNEQVINS